MTFYFGTIYPSHINDRGQALMYYLKKSHKEKIHNSVLQNCISQ